MDDIKKDIDILFKDIEKSSLYKRYIEITRQMSNNKELIKLIDEIKKLQKILVNTDDKVIEKELLNLYNKLNSYPIYQSYLDILRELNNELSNIKIGFEQYFKFILKIK